MAPVHGLSSSVSLFFRVNLMNYCLGPLSSASMSKEGGGEEGDVLLLFASFPFLLLSNSDAYLGDF